jgi:hypothetical protein
LECAHGQELLRWGCVSLQQGTLALIVAVAIALDAGEHLGMPCLQDVLDIDMSASEDILAMATGLLANRGDWLDHVKQRVWAEG